MITDPLLAEAAAADSAALTAAATSAEEALACQRDALAALAVGWRSETGTTATDSMQCQCARGSDIVSGLHRVAAELAALHDVRDSSNLPATPAGSEHLGEQPSATPAVPPPAGPVTVAADSVPSATPGPAQVPPGPGAAQLPAPPWTGTAAPAVAPASPAWQPGGSIPPLPDLGGALAGLVSQIAQALGSYSDSPGAPPATPADKTRSGHKAAAPTRRHADPPKKPVAAGLPPSAVPKSAAAQPPPVTTGPTVPPPGLLAAERPADPIPPVSPPVAAPAAPTPAPAASEPALAVTAPPPPPPEARTPCEIAADELPKVGE